ncbi:helix-turn-helix domain-containing protein [Actinacidiphila alni]|uniref:helix-turn-helix domain-containing protein n=1 Tax=Actinacidiphila alni TaxID=380248 RepID=UPI0034540EDF
MHMVAEEYPETAKVDGAAVHSPPQAATFVTPPTAPSAAPLAPASTAASAAPSAARSAATPVRSPVLSVGRDGDDPPLWMTAHSHPEHMLLWSASATLTIGTPGRDWLVPPGYGLWVPGWTEHSVSTLRFGEGSVLAFAPERCPITWARPTGVSITPLLRELIAHLCRTGPQDTTRAPAEALAFALLAPLPDHDIQVAMPTDPRVRTIAERLVADPSDPRELAAWADHVHAGVRTLSRLFVAETGLSFARWRTQVRIRAAIHLLSDGATVESTARAVGYRKPSAFIAAFRRATGQTPGTYLGPGDPPPPSPPPPLSPR